MAALALQSLLHPAYRGALTALFANPMTTNFPFYDLHSFKDFVVFVRMCAPDNFPIREGVPPGAQWSLDLAFQALREGLTLSAREKGDRSEFIEASKRIDEAYGHYRAGKKSDGFIALDDAHKILKRIRSK